MRQFFYVLCFLFVVACTATNDNILPEKKMRVVLWDIIKADAYMQEVFARDTTMRDAAIKNAAMQYQIFRLHQVTKEQFYNSYNFYKADERLYKALMDSITATTSTERYQQYDKYKNGFNGDSKPKGDSAAAEK
jgi:hypothetical protein